MSSTKIRPQQNRPQKGDHRVSSSRPGLPGGRRDENRKARTEALGKAALALFLERGIEAVTIDEIARSAGVAKGSFYRYFDDKAALVAWLVDPVARQMRDAFARTEARLSAAKDRAGAYTAYQELALALVPLAIFHFDVVRLYLQESRAPSRGARAPIAALVQTVDEGSVRLSQVAVDHGLVAVDDPRITAFATVGAIEQLAMSVLRGRLDASPPEIVSTLIRMILDGVGTRATAAKDAAKDGGTA